VRGAALHRPPAHGLGDGVGQLGRQQLAALQGLLEVVEHGLVQALALDGRGEDVGAEDVGVGLGQVALAEGPAVRAPLR
jgi:hypothetical protein